MTLKKLDNCLDEILRDLICNSISPLAWDVKLFWPWTAGGWDYFYLCVGSPYNVLECSSRMRYFLLPSVADWNSMGSPFSCCVSFCFSSSSHCFFFRHVLLLLPSRFLLFPALVPGIWNFLVDAVVAIIGNTTSFEVLFFFFFFLPREHHPREGHIHCISSLMCEVTSGV